MSLWDSLPIHASRLFKISGKEISNENLSFLDNFLKILFESDEQDMGLTSALSMAEHLTDEQISGFQDHRFLSSHYCKLRNIFSVMTCYHGYHGHTDDSRESRIDF